MSFRVEDHADRAAKALPSIIRDKPRIAALVNAIAEEAQELQGTGVDALDGLSLEDAKGVWLDRWGRGFDVERNGLDDDSYRVIIQTTIAAQFGASDTDTILAMAAKLADLAINGAGGAETTRVGFFLMPPAAFALELRTEEAVPQPIRGMAYGLLLLAAAGGVGIQFISESNPDDNTIFGFDDDPDAGGFADDPVSSGAPSELIHD